MSSHKRFAVNSDGEDATKKKPRVEDEEHEVSRKEKKKKKKSRHHDSDQEKEVKEPKQEESEEDRERRKEKKREKKEKRRREREAEEEKEREKEEHHREREKEEERQSRHDREKDRSKRDHRRERNREREEEPAEAGRPAWQTAKVKAHSDKIQQRKLLWSKPKADKEDGSAASTSETGNKSAAWTSKIAATTGGDSSQMSKFARLMGIKKPVGDAAPKNALEEETMSQERIRQDSMRHQLDRQYAKARSATHMGRGKGLGFGSF